MRRLVQLAALVALAAPSVGLTGCFTARYLGQQGKDGLKLITSRRRVSDVIDDPATPPRVRDRLRLAMEARRFGIERLGLRGGAEFTCYVDTHGPVAWNLTAAYRDRLEPRVWSFPLVGRVPYLGFFDHQAALDEARRLEAAGYDTYVRPVGGFSSLGYIKSPIYSAMIDDDGPLGEVRTVETVLHEMAHTTAWIGSATDLNESFATVVGDRGAALFFRERAGLAAATELESEKREAAEHAAARAEALGDWLDGEYRALAAFYRRAHDERWSAERLARGRAEEFARITRSFQAAFPRSRRARLSDGQLNNAVLISLKVYYPGASAVDGTGDARVAGSDARGHLQEELLGYAGGDLRRYIGLYREAQDRRDSADWLHRWAQKFVAAHPGAPVDAHTATAATR